MKINCIIPVEIYSHLNHSPYPIAFHFRYSTLISVPIRHQSKDERYSTQFSLEITPPQMLQEIMNWGEVALTNEQWTHTSFLHRNLVQVQNLYKIYNPPRSMKICSNLKKFAFLSPGTINFPLPLLWKLDIKVSKNKNLWLRLITF